MSNPWDADHGLDDDALAERLARALALGQYEGTSYCHGAPCIDEAGRPSWFAAGWDCDVFRVVDAGGHPWLCKLPKRARVQEWIRKEAGLLEDLAAAGFGAAPRLGLRGAAGELPYEWIGVSVVPGRALFGRLDAVDPAVVGASLGSWLRRLHGLRPASLGAAPATVRFRRDQHVGEPAGALAALARHLPAALVRRVEHTVLRHEAGSPEAVPAAFVHGDLFPEHIHLGEGQLDPRDAVVGLIDWADAGWGDPAVDLALPAWLLGDRFLAAALAAYGTGDQPALGRRVVSIAIAIGVHDVEIAERGAPNVPLAERLGVIRARAAEGWFDADRAEA